MTTFVIVPGAFCGGASYRRLRPLLRAAGCEVFTPSLTGLGERAHLAHSGIDLNLHIQDVVNLLEYEDLYEVALVGHSYSGMVVTGVADVVPERIGHLVYLEARVPEDGESLFSMGSPERVAALRVLARDQGDGWRVPPFPADSAYLGLTSQEDLDLYTWRQTPHPIMTWEQPVRLTSSAALTIPRTYIDCTAQPPTGPGRPTYQRFIERAQTQAGWQYRQLHSGHVPNITHPRELADLLVDIASSTPPRVAGE
jgi:pimeloyl-ACP methyl ester carboxylesterase